MTEIVLMWKVASVGQSGGSQSRYLCSVLLVFAGIVLPGMMVDPSNATAQQWEPRNVARASDYEPMVAPMLPTHLVIEAPQPRKHNHSRHHAVPQMAPPTHPESVGGGYWNQPDNLVHGTVVQDDQNMDGEFNGPELPVTHAPKKKHDLAHVIPSHANKTPRPVAIPNASRTTGWKQPYSYGHFGAKHNRQWSIHHGHQRSYTQWTFR